MASGLAAPAIDTCQRVWAVAERNPSRNACTASVRSSLPRKAPTSFASLEKSLSISFAARNVSHASAKRHNRSHVIIASADAGSSSQQTAESPAASSDPTSPKKKPVFADVDAEVDSFPAGDDVDATSPGQQLSVGEVDKILGSRVVGRRTEYLIQWKDDHPDSWEPDENVAKDLTAGYEQPWWVAARKADEGRLKELLEEGRDVNSIDENFRTALAFASGVGNEKAVSLLLEAGADVHWQDKDGYSALHIAAGYTHTSIVRLLLDQGADPHLEDAKGRSPLSLAQQLLKNIPTNNPLQFGRRITLDQIVKMLDEATFEEVEVEQILDKREGPGGVVEYLVKWSDGSEDSWEPIENIGEDLVADYEEGLEYGVAEKILEKKDVYGKVQYLVKWVDSDENTWEPIENIALEVVAEFENISVEEVEKMLPKEVEVA